VQILFWLQGFFQFAIVWSLGSAITGSSRKKFDEFFRTLVVGGFPEFPKPKSCKISKVLSLGVSVTRYDAIFMCAQKLT